MKSSLYLQQAYDSSAINKIEIFAHRGYWLKESEKNTKTAFERAFDSGFGIETDLRDIKGTIVISHNMPKGDEMTFEELLKLFDGRKFPPPVSA